ncbi:MAG: hypothetical protein M3067_05785 [Chloroflexota bacterium]|nr:hypothetical protein [Chloroflexota bacterium]
MKLFSMLIGILAAILIGCASPQPSLPPSASPRTPGLQELIAAIAAASAPVRQADTFEGAPIPAKGVLLCLGKEEVRVYSFGSEEERAAAAKTIDPKDPSHVGTSIVEWTGNPRFWQSGRILVLYLGSDARTEAILTSILGQPFARGAGGGGLGGPNLSAC